MQLALFFPVLLAVIFQQFHSTQLLLAELAALVSQGPVQYYVAAEFILEWLSNAFKPSFFLTSLVAELRLTNLIADMHWK